MSRALASLTAIALLAAPAAAAVRYGFNADYAGVPIPTIGAVNVSMNPEIVREASEVPLRPRSNDPEYIDPRDAEDLIADLREELEDELSRTGAYAPMVGEPVGELNVTIESATSSNPAQTRIGQSRGLDSLRSRGRGSAAIVAELVGPDGNTVATFTYRWEESTFDLGAAPRIDWYGAEHAFDRFSARLARELESPEVG